MLNEIFIRRRKKVFIESGSDVLSDAYIATVLKNLSDIGYTLSEDVISVLRTFSVQELVDFYEDVVTSLKKLKGANFTFKPMYPNFPKQVMNMHEAQLYLNAITHYLTGEIPEYPKDARVPLLDDVELEVIDLGTKEEFADVVGKILTSRTSISETDKADLDFGIENNLIAFPEEIPHKEVLGHFSKTILEKNPTEAHRLHGYFKVPTDVLRVATALSDGDVSLAQNTRFRNFTRAERKFILGALDSVRDFDEDLFSNKDRWLRLGEKLHPGEFKKRFPNAAANFNKLRNEKKPETLGGKVERYLAEGDAVAAAEKLKNRPGQFARRLDHLLRTTSKAKERQAIVDSFAEVAVNVSTPVLLQVLNHFEQRNDQSLRVIIPKGKVSKIAALENELPKLPKKYCNAVIKTCKKALEEKFSDLEPLGNVYVGEELKGFPVPFSQRSASKTAKAVSRGSRFDIPEGDTLRFFIHWKNLESGGPGYYGRRVDLDLSAVLYDADWNYLEHISYTNLKSAKYRAHHSGDITDAPNGAAEFIDVNIESVLKYGGRFVIPSVISYSGQLFSDIPECFGGWMIRQKPNSGEIFEPSTVVDKVDVTSETKYVIPVILDLQERQAIWADLAITSNTHYYGRNVESNKNTLVLMGRSLTELKKADLYTLFELHGKARGKLVDNPEDADVVFSKDDGITPYHIEEIASEFLK